MDFDALQRIVASDARARGASVLCRPAFWDNALQLFLKASHIFIVTGFYIQKACAPETDGPPGAVVLGRALEKVGKQIVLLTDPRNYTAVNACSRSVEGPVVACSDDPAKVRLDTDLLVFIERPGRASDGRYYNMKGVDIGDVVVPLDDIAEPTMARGIPVLGIGDGGNEAGMGLFYHELAQLMPHYAPCLSRVSADVCLPVDISNWGGYALAALLSSFYRRWVGLDPGEEASMLKALVNAGAVDGIKGTQSMSVDGVPVDGPGGLDETALYLKNWYFGSFKV
ncbi:MAG: DUF4392 domain-containing protein [Synergistaceae bacterium]|jgi:hypothetical protein|nr:DUF4392 domain-containing protein [Synergistaceae bacterium]